MAEIDKQGRDHQMSQGKAPEPSHQDPTTLITEGVVGAISAERTTQLNLQPPTGDGGGGSSGGKPSNAGSEDYTVSGAISSCRVTSVRGETSGGATSIRPSDSSSGDSGGKSSDG